jgi:hypothetical protein
VGQEVVRGSERTVFRWRSQLKGDFHDVCISKGEATMVGGL